MAVKRLQYKKKPEGCAQVRENDLLLDFVVKAPLAQVMAEADQARRTGIGEQIELCTIYNAKSGRCSEDCAFCAQSAHHQATVPAYPLRSAAELIDAARQAKSYGAARFGIVTSGNRLSSEELGCLCAAVRRIVAEVGISVCCSLGALEETALRQLRQAGARRYHHNLETSARFYPQIVSTHRYEERRETVRAAKAAGFEICSGGIIGLGETWDDRRDLAQTLKELAVDSVPLNILVPLAGIRLEHQPPLSAVEAIRAIALFRLLMPTTMIKIAAGRESCLKDFQAMAYLAGATGMLIGGYLTVRGRAVSEDQALAREVWHLWKK
ncbi:MAG: biotin synthase BioB [Candidatus Omnitrophica bacterium]|nr:biotin synthase BioB [Candidatus Omnitrophota bacterium]